MSRSGRSRSRDRDPPAPRFEAVADARELIRRRTGSRERDYPGEGHQPASNRQEERVYRSSDAGPRNDRRRYDDYGDRRRHDDYDDRRRYDDRRQYENYDDRRRYEEYDDRRPSDAAYYDDDRRGRGGGQSEYAGRGQNRGHDYRAPPHDPHQPQPAERSYQAPPPPVPPPQAVRQPREEQEYVASYPVAAPEGVAPWVPMAGAGTKRSFALSSTGTFLNAATTIETDVHKLEGRMKQITYGKNTIGYDRYIAEVPVKQRRSYNEHPRTPNPYEIQSKRAWDGRVMKWRRELHRWDPPLADGQSKAEGGEATEGGEAGQGGKQLETSNESKEGHEDGSGNGNGGRGGKPERDEEEWMATTERDDDNGDGAGDEGGAEDDVL